MSTDPISKSPEVVPHYHSLNIDKISELLHVDLQTGLHKREAASRLKKYGHNQLDQKKGKSLFKILIQQFIDPIVGILFGAAILAFAFGQILEGIAVGIVIIINSLIGFFMEWQASISMTKLTQMSHAMASVYREGKRTRIDSTYIVPGDVMHLEAGDLVTADARIIEHHNLSVKESALTGESLPVDKYADEIPENTILAERRNMVHSGTVVLRGNARAIVTATGNHTELGNISKLAEEAEKVITPLDKRLAKLSKKLIFLTLGLTILILGMGILQGKEWLLMIETAVALAVAAIPEGLPVISTISLARGMLRLAEEHVIVKSLSSVQTLGEANIILTDKTGTITENNMFVDSFIFDQNIIPLKEILNKSSASHNAHPDWELITKVGVLCNNGVFDPKQEKNNSGDPLEIALLRMAHEAGWDLAKVEREHDRIAEIPFDSNIKMMATVNRHESGYIICVKGATMSVLERCTRVQLDGEIQGTQSDDADRWSDTVDQLAKKGLRVLSFAYKHIDTSPDDEDFIHDLTFLGLVGFIDPVRGDVREAVETCKRAGIKVVMITGDHPETASSIAQAAGLVEDGISVQSVHGKDLVDIHGDTINASQKEDLLKANVFSRVNPEQKLELVTFFQENGYIAGMTGDGVNDAPALKKADIGIAMGQRGTEAAKEVADIILKDDAFPSIVTAIRQGRIIFENIRKFVVYLLSCNLSEIIVVAIASLLNMPLPLLPLQILFLNMVTDVFPALALGLDEGEKNIMDKPPRDSREPIITVKHWWAIITYALGISIAVLGIEQYSLTVLKLEGQIVNNVTFYTLILAQLFNVFNLPGREVSFLRNEVTRNVFVWLAIILCVLITVIVYYIPVAREALSLTTVHPEQLILVFGFSLIPLVIVQILKRVIKVVD